MADTWNLDWDDESVKCPHCGEARQELSDTTPIARKRHVCHWCGEAIEPGERYCRWVNAGDGEFEIVKAHPECKTAWDSDPENLDGIWFGEYSRGCMCQHGLCECDKGAT